MVESVNAETPIEHIIETVLQWAGVESASHAYEGVEFCLDGYEFGHVHHGWQCLHINYPRRMRDALIEEGLTEPHRYFPETGWTNTPVVDRDSIDHALWLLRLSYLYRSLLRRNTAAGRVVMESIDHRAELANLDPSDQILDLYEEVFETIE